jgi:hypothetical protein
MNRERHPLRQPTPPPPLAFNEFPLGAVLTITCGSAERIFCTYGDQCRILGYMGGHVPPPADVQAYIDAARPAVLEQHPDLAAVTAPPADAPDVDVLTWLQQQETNHGPTLTLAALGETK